MCTFGRYHECIGGYHDACGGYHEYIWDVQYIGGYQEYIGGYHEFIGECSVHGGHIMMHVGEQVGKNLSNSIEKPNVLNIPNVLMISPRCTHDIPRCTHSIPPMYS